MTRSLASSLSRPARRTLVLAVYAGYAAIVAAVFAAGLDRTDLPASASLLFCLASWGGVIAFMQMKDFWMWGNAPDTTLDERQLQARLRAYYASYVGVSSLAVLALTVASIGVDLIEPVRLTYTHMAAIGWGVFLLVLTLPTAVLAWTERND